MKYLANERSGRRVDIIESSPMQFYTKNKRGQYELFPQARIYAWKRRLTFLAIILAIGTISALMMNGG